VGDLCFLVKMIVSVATDYPENTSMEAYSSYLNHRSGGGFQDVWSGLLPGRQMVSTQPLSALASWPGQRPGSKPHVLRYTSASLAMYRLARGMLSLKKSLSR